MTETPKYTPKDLIDVYPKDPDSNECDAYVGIAWHRLGLCLGERAARLFGTFRARTESPSQLNRREAKASEAAFIALLGFSPEDLLLELFVAEHEYDAPRTYAWRRS